VDEELTRRLVEEQVDAHDARESRRLGDESCEFGSLLGDALGDDRRELSRCARESGILTRTAGEVLLGVGVEARLAAAAQRLLELRQLELWRGAETDVEVDQLG